MARTRMRVTQCMVSERVERGVDAIREDLFFGLRRGHTAAIAGGESWSRYPTTATPLRMVIWPGDELLVASRIIERRRSCRVSFRR